MQATDAVVSGTFSETANDRMKRRARMWQSNALVVAVLIHFGVLALWPTMTSGVAERPVTEIQVLTPPEIDLPKPPEVLARPAVPVVGTSNIPDDVSIPTNRWEDWTPERLNAPPAERRTEVEEFERIVPSMVVPRVLNQADVERALLRHYPPLLRDAGIGGQVDLTLWLDEHGKVVRSELARTSGYTSLDEAALKVLDVMRLSPALNRNRPTRVIVTIPIVFTIR